MIDAIKIFILGAITGSAVSILAGSHAVGIETKEELWDECGLLRRLIVSAVLRKR